MRRGLGGRRASRPAPARASDAATWRRQLTQRGDRPRVEHLKRRRPGASGRRAGAGGSERCRSAARRVRARARRRDGRPGVRGRADPLARASRRAPARVALAVAPAPAARAAARAARRAQIVGAGAAVARDDDAGRGDARDPRQADQLPRRPPRGRASTRLAGRRRRGNLAARRQACCHPRRRLRLRRRRAVVRDRPIALRRLRRWTTRRSRSTKRSQAAVDGRHLAVSRPLVRRPGDPDADQQPRQPRRDGRRARRPAAAVVARRARPLAARRLDRRAPARRAAAQARRGRHAVERALRPARLVSPAAGRRSGASTRTA